jgi:hypothetical protein
MSPILEAMLESLGNTSSVATEAVIKVISAEVVLITDPPLEMPLSGLV